MAWKPEPLDRRAPMPLHGQIALQVRRAVAAGDLLPGDLLPPEPRLAAELGVARGTVALALNQLVREHRLTRRRGVGTVVTDGPAPAAAENDRNAGAGRGAETAAIVSQDAGRLEAQIHRVYEELRTRLDEVQALQARLAGELFRLRRQREWNRQLRVLTARQRAERQPRPRRRRLS